MKALIHGWNTTTVIKSNKTMAPLQQIIFSSQAKKTNEE
jgi:hypothetical protein